MWKNGNPHILLVKTAATLENHLAISSNVKYKLVLQLSISTLRYLLKRCENIHLSKHEFS